MGTAMVTPASASAYCSARLPKKMQKPEAMAKPIEDRFSCAHTQRHHRMHPSSQLVGITKKANLMQFYMTGVQMRPPQCKALSRVLCL